MDSTSSTNPTDVLAGLHELVRVLREAKHLSPDAQRELATLVDELIGALAAASLPGAETAHLAKSAAHLAEAIQHRHDATLLAKAKARLEDAVVRAETSVPVTAGIVRRILEALADLGI